MPEYNKHKERMTSTDDEKKLRLRFDDIRKNHQELIDIIPMMTKPKYTYEDIVNG